MAIQMDEKLKKSQHYVPKFYLRHFTFDANRVHIYDRLERRSFDTSIDSICQEKLLYETKWRNASEALGEYVLPNKLEDSFVDDEGKYDSMIKDLLSKTSNVEIASFINANKENLSEFVVNLYLRNPIILKDIVDSYSDEKIKENKTLAAVEELFGFWHWGSPESLVEHSIKKSTFDRNIENGPSHVLKQQLIDMRITVLKSMFVPFITSSFPIVLNISPEMPPMSDVLNIILPLSPKIAIRFSNDPFHQQKKEGTVISANDELVKSINALYFDYNIEQARFLISKSVYVIKEMVNSELKG